MFSFLLLRSSEDCTSNHDECTYTPDGIVISKTDDNFAERGREFLSRFLSNDRQSRTIAEQVVDYLNKNAKQKAIF